MKWLAPCLCTIAAAIWTGPALACGHGGGADYCGPELISALYVTAAGSVYVQPSSSWTGVVCSPVSGSFAILNPAAANFEQLYALLLSAKLSGEQVTLVMDPSQPQCTITYVTLQ
jgi:uncharacterized membrane protein